MSYENYTLEDFLTDREFKKWVINPDTNTQLFWGKWIDCHPEQKETILKARELLLSYRFKEPEIILKEEKEDILEGILGRKKSPLQRPRLYMLGYAAAVSLITLFSVLAFSFFSDQSEETIIAMVVKQNPAGQKSTIQLPDGTRVWLNSASKIKFPNKFIHDRTVELHGEAYFEVAENPKKSFIVISNGIMTTALGTSFNIKAYHEERKVEVQLISGKVSIERFDEDLKRHEKMFIGPGEQVIYNTYSHLLKKASSKREVALWKNGIISFKKAGFEKIKKELERWYGVKIEVQHLNRALSYTGDFDNESLERVLERMAFTEKFFFKIEEDTVKIEFN